MKIQTILRGIRQADKRFGLIQPGDKIAVALSGGKDSMLLLTALRQYQKFPIRILSWWEFTWMWDSRNSTMI